MTPTIATCAFALGILGLFALDRDRKARTSKALWIPVVWLSISASRAVSQWLTATRLMHVSVPVDTADQILEGSPLDRFLLTVLVVLSIIVLVSRGQRVTRFLRANGPIVLFFLYCAVSVLWSDYPEVAFKRWIKDLGDLTMVLIILTDRDPLAALKRFLARVGFVLVPVSVLLIRYYPNLGWAYNTLVWKPSYVGVGEDKNALGIVCLLFGVASVWRISRILWGAEEPPHTGSLVAQCALLAMVLWLFWMAESMTSLTCFLIASTLVVATGFSPFARKHVRLIVVAMVFVAFFALFLDPGGSLVESLGRNSTLTGRTDIWRLVLGLAANPLVGTGFESFWLGPRLKQVWSVYWWHPNEAHNGYLEVYLNLGWVGVAVLAVVMITGYRNVVAALRRYPDTGSLKVAYFVTAVIYNFTESAIRTMFPIWIAFLLVTMAVPESPALEDALPVGICHAVRSAELEPQVAHALRFASRQEII